jgi:hypothetical protein
MDFNPYLKIFITTKIIIDCKYSNDAGITDPYCLQSTYVFIV